MKKLVQIRTEYGPFEIEVIYCDGPDCLNKGVEAYLPGWLQVDPIGINVATFGDMTLMGDTSHYCSKECLKKKVS